MDARGSRSRWHRTWDWLRRGSLGDDSGARRRVHAQLAGTDATRFDGKTLAGMHRGVKWRLDPISGDTLLSIAAPHTRPATFSRRTWFDRLGARLLPHRSIRWGDERLDERVQVDTADVALAEACLTHPAFHHALLDSDGRVRTIQLGAGRLQCRLPAGALSGDECGQRLHAEVEVLAELAAALRSPSFEEIILPAPPPARRRHPGRIATLALLALLPLILLALWFTNDPPILHDWQLAWGTFTWFAAAAVLFTLLSALMSMIRRRSETTPWKQAWLTALFTPCVIVGLLAVGGSAWSMLITDEPVHEILLLVVQTPGDEGDELIGALIHPETGKPVGFRLRTGRRWRQAEAGRDHLRWRLQRGPFGMVWQRGSVELVIGPRDGPPPPIPRIDAAAFTLMAGKNASR